MEWKISNRKERITLAIVTALVAFSTVFLLTGYIMTQVYGLKPGDQGYRNYLNEQGEPNTPYQDMLVNGCMTKEHTEADQTFTLDTKGLEELGMIWYDPNTCFDIAKNAIGYDITSVQTYGDDQMRITLTKQK